MHVLGFEEYHQEARHLANALSAPYASVELHRFPDGESRVRVPLPLSDPVIVCRSLNRPNDKLIELMLTAGAVRESGVKRVILVAPYLCYQRQDIAFHPGEAVSQRIVGRFLADYFDELVTVDPHLHRVHSLAQAVPCRRAVCCSAGPLMGTFLNSRRDKPMLVGPDSESEQWVAAIARRQRLDYVVAAKRRRGDRAVDIRLPDYPYAGRAIVLVDDMASTGRTLVNASQQLYAAGAERVDCLVTHALFADHAELALHQAGIGEIWSSDSVPHPSNVIQLAPILAQAIGQ